MRAAAIAAAVFAAFVGVMYLRFSGDAVPSPEPRPSPIVGTDGSVCIVARRSDAPDPTPTLVGGTDRAPCATFHPDDLYSVLDPTPADVPTPEWRESLPGMLRGREVHEFRYGSEIEMPEGVALIMETGCTQCDGPATGLSRVYKIGQGTTYVEQLFTPEKVGMLPQVVQTEKGPMEMAPAISGLAVARDGSDMAVSVCSVGFCGYGPDGFVSENRVFRSVDGGVSWSEIGKLEPNEYLVAALKPGFVISAFSTSPATELTDIVGPTFRLFPDGGSIERPTVSGQLGWPFVTSGGEVFWVDKDGSLIRQDGTTFLENRPPRAQIQPDILTDPDGRSHFIAFSTAADKQSRHYVSFVGAGGGPGLTISLPGYVHLGAMISRSQIFANAGVQELVHRPLPSPFVGSLPLLIDFEGGRLHPIAGPFLEPPLLNGRNTIRAVQQGPFARVVNTDNTCLYIRTEPSTTAPTLDCAAEGVLLRYAGGVTFTEGVDWLKIAIPSGVVGWASSTYLETIGIFQLDSFGQP